MHTHKTLTEIKTCPVCQSGRMVAPTGNSIARATRHADEPLDMVAAREHQAESEHQHADDANENRS